MRPTVHSYDDTTFDFGSILRRTYDVDDLTKLRSDTPLDRLTVETDQATELHAKFYEQFERNMSALYREFVATVVPEVLQTDEFCFQRVPTFRVHLPGNVAVGEFHTDADYNHRAGEINFWVPFTPAWGSNSVWIEDELGSGNYQAATVHPGQALVFDAVHWSHGNVVNETGSTRVSFDFRCIRMRDYQASELRSVDAGLGLWIGEYFDVL